LEVLVERDLEVAGSIARARAGVPRRGDGVGAQRWAVRLSVGAAPRMKKPSIAGRLKRARLKRVRLKRVRG
jgi:hypothetical protein